MDPFIRRLSLIGRSAVDETFPSAIRAAVQPGSHSPYARAMSWSRLGPTGIPRAFRYITAMAQATVRGRRSSRRHRPKAVDEGGRTGAGPAVDRLYGQFGTAAGDRHTGYAEP